MTHNEASVMIRDSATPTDQAQPTSASVRGIATAFLSPLFLGFAPVLGKFAYLGGSDPFTVAATRTVIAAGILWAIYLVFFRSYLYVHPAGLIGCIVVGTVNGIGSLFYYNGLTYLDASVAQLLNATYLIVVVVLTRIGGQIVTRRTAFRALLALLAITLLTGGMAGKISWVGAGLIIANAICFAGTYVMSQRVLYEIPAPTFTLYTLTTMAVVVVMARVVYRLEWIPQSPDAAFAIFALGVTTALSRLALFMGIKKFGSLQTVFVAIFESLVALLLAAIFLRETLTLTQWVGVGVLLCSLLLIRGDDISRGWVKQMPIFDIAGMSFQKIAFTQAFGKDHASKLTPDELEAVRRMMEPPR